MSKKSFKSVKPVAEEVAGNTPAAAVELAVEGLAELGSEVQAIPAPAKKAKTPKQPKDWLPAFLAKLATRGATRETLTSVTGKNAFVLKHNGKTVTWFRKETDLARVLEAVPA